MHLNKFFTSNFIRLKIFLLGFMGTGKSYWGRRWAEKYDLQFYDLDNCIEQTTGLTIPQIFKQHGEAFFREKEKELLRSFENKQDFILSTGGGTPCFFDNMRWMNEYGTTVYLHTPVDVLKERLLSEKDHRPLIKELKEDELEGFIHNKLTERNVYYQQAVIILESVSVTDATFAEIKSNDV